MKNLSSLLTPFFLASVTLGSLCMTGCAAALIGAGAVGCYAVAKDLEDGQLIDTPKKKDDNNKGWFGANK